MSNFPNAGNDVYRTEEPVPFADKGIWIFVAIDLAIFALFFLIFLIEKNAAQELFVQSQQKLDPLYGFVNTVILITSSWLLVKSLRAMELSTSGARFYLAGSILFGATFVVLKLFEYGEKFSAGISIVENTFFTFYYLLTFIHFCHVIGGLIALSVMLSALKAGANR